MENKYYLDDRGLISLLKEVSTSIKNHTSESIVVDDKGSIENPNNLTTVKSVVNYLKDRKNLTINQDFSSTSSNSYNVETGVVNYNGEEEVELDIQLIKPIDIENLFNN